MGTDVNASFSGSSSATAGLRTDSSYRYGDVIIGAPKPQPPYVLLALGGLVIAAVIVFLIRRN